MPDSTQIEIFQPCLLDRLSDDEPENPKESRIGRGFSMQRYRGSVLRDLRWLLNAPAKTSGDGLEDFPEAECSVINFGTPDLCGLTPSSLNLGELERKMAECIFRFEPRILRHTLTVRAVPGVNKSSPNVIGFEIRGSLWASPVPEELFLKSELDLETGQMHL